jgi:hypothetical protein
VVTEARFCRYCGTARTTGGRFCETCGAQFGTTHTDGVADPAAGTGEGGIAGEAVWLEPSATPPPVVSGRVASGVTVTAGTASGSGAFTGGTAPKPAAHSLSYRRRMRRSLDGIVRSGRLSARRVFMAFGGLMVAVGVYLPWLTIENVSWNGTDVDFHWGGPWTSVAILLGAIIILIAAARVVSTAAPDVLEIVAAILGLAIFLIALVRLLNMGEFVAAGVQLSYGWSATIWGGLIALATGLYPTIRRRLRRGTAPG